MYDDYREHGFVALSINLGEDMETVVKPYARQNTNPFLRDNNSVWPVYTQNNAIPLNYVIDTAGVIRFLQEGFNEATIKATIQQYLPDPIEHDVGVTRLVGPSGSYDSGAVFTPACSLRNYGTNAETYPVRMRVGEDYDTTVTVTNHQPNALVYVEFPQWTALVRGSNAVTCTTELGGDDIGSNNALTTTATVHVYDVAVTAILAPADSVDSGATVVPMAEVRNLGTIADMAKVHFYIGGLYHDSVDVPLQPGRTDTAVLRAWSPEQLGAFPVRCTTATLRAEMVPANNLMTGEVRVVRASGVEEPAGTRLGFALYESYPNPVSGRVDLRYSLPRPAQVAIRIYSAGGELVCTLVDDTRSPGLHRVAWNGRDDTGRRAGHGVYYCRMTAPGFDTGRKLTLVE
jgi:hypothetical protein